MRKWPSHLVQYFLRNRQTHEAYLRLLDPKFSQNYAKRLKTVPIGHFKT